MQPKMKHRTFFIFTGQALKALSAAGIPTFKTIDTTHDSQIFILNFTKKTKEVKN